MMRREPGGGGEEGAAAVSQVESCDSSSVGLEVYQEPAWVAGRERVVDIVESRLAVLWAKRDDVVGDKRARRWRGRRRRRGMRWRGVRRIHGGVMGGTAAESLELGLR